MDKIPSFCKKQAISIRSSIVSPMPIIPPQQMRKPGGMDGFHLLLDRMRGTKLTEIGRGGLDIAVIILHSAIVKRLELGAG